MAVSVPYGEAYSVACTQGETITVSAWAKPIFSNPNTELGMEFLFYWYKDLPEVGADVAYQTYTLYTTPASMRVTCDPGYSVYTQFWGHATVPWDLGITHCQVMMSPRSYGSPLASANDTVRIDGPFYLGIATPQPAGSAPCYEPYVTGSIVNNPGAELGTVGVLLPYMFDPLTATDYSLGFAQGTAGTAVAYKWGNTSVRSGSKSIELNQWSVLGSGPHYLQFIRGEACDTTYYAGGWGPYHNYSARVQPGDTLTYSFWARTDDTLNATRFSARSIEWFTNESQFIAWDYESGPILTNTWTQYSFSRVAPANAYYADAWIRVATEFNDGLSYFDDFTLDIS